MSTTPRKKNPGAVGEPDPFAPPQPSQERIDAGVVAESDGQEPNDEVIAAGEAIDVEAIEEASTAAVKAGAPHGGPVENYSPASTMNPYMSPEEQGMEMTPQIVGPPGWGSPDPTTSAGRLLPLSQHPLNPNLLPDDHPARISEDYGEGYVGTLSGADTVTSRPGVKSDLERHSIGDFSQEEAAAEEPAPESQPAEGENA